MITTVFILVVCIGLLIYSGKSIYDGLKDGKSFWCFFDKCDKCNNNCCACYYSDINHKDESE